MLFRRLSLVFAGIAVAVCSFVGRADEVGVNLLPVDSVTRKILTDVEVMAFLPGDSALVAEGYPSMDGDILNRDKMVVRLPVKKTDTTYNLIIERSGYNMRVVPVTVLKESQNYDIISLGEIGLLKAPRQLNEVTVEATRIKLYYKGDTLVYNADAFALPEGSMLDALIRQLDGVTIDRNGQIFCNGRKVQSLQLDGRKLFDGSPQTLMKNLGAYTVKKIKVYDLTPEMEKFLGYSSALTADGQKPLVMDVNLKKEYSIGKWVNIDAGYGTDNRYLGRAFLLGFTKNLAISAFFNANNLSNSDDPGREDFWSMGSAGSREASYLSGGLSYQYDATGGKFKMNGTVAANSSDATNRSGSVRTNFLPSGNTFEHSFNNARHKNFGINTHHTISGNSSRVYYSVMPTVSYSRHNSEGDSESLALGEDIGRLTAEDIEAIYSRDPDRIVRHIINRSLSRTKSNSTAFNATLAGNLVVRLKGTRKFKHNLSINAEGRCSGSTGNDFNRYMINYGADPLPANDTYAYTRRHPASYSYANASAAYEVNLRNRHTLSLRYYYGRDREVGTYARFMVGEMADADAESLKFGMIPPDGELEPVRDLQNSNSTRYWSNDHRIEFRTSGKFGRSDIDDEGALGSIGYGVYPTLRLLNRNYRYMRAGLDTLAVRDFVMPQISGYFSYAIESGEADRHYFILLDWSSSPLLFAMNNIINTENTTDPLNIFRGNPSLRNAYSHHAGASLQFRRHALRRSQNHRLDFSCTFIDNRITRGTLYNPLTGVRTSTMYNVDGYRSMSLRWSSDGRIKSWKNRLARILTGSISVAGGDTRSIDMITSTTSDAAGMPERSFVYNRSLNSAASLALTFGKNNDLSIGYSGTLNRYSGDAADYQSFSAADISLNVRLMLGLPEHFSIVSTLNYYRRFGYSDERLNAGEYIWNVSGSWHWTRPKLTFIIDAYDLLQQIKSVNYYVNALGRTESWSNTIPRYLMVRVRYHLDLSPK